MRDLAYDKLATRARELLSGRPRPSNGDVTDVILAEIAAEFEVPGRLRDGFSERLRPAMVGIVSSVRSALVKGQVVETVRPYFAKPLPSAEPPATVVSVPEHHAPASALGDGQASCGDQDAPAIPEPGAHSPSGPQWMSGVPTPASGGHSRDEAPGLFAALSESGRTDGHQHENGTHQGLVAPSAPEPAATEDSAPNVVAPPAPVTPLSLRMDVLDGWRALRDEPLFVPEHGELTWGAATRGQWHRRLQWHHDQAHGHIESAKRERKVLELIEATPGAACLNDVLDGRALAGGES